MENVPKGHRLNHQGHLVPEKAIAPYDLDRDKVVVGLFDSAMHHRDEIAAFKNKAMEEIEAFMDRAASDYGTKLGGRKGNLTLTSFDGRYQVKVQVSDRIEFDERIQIARQLIDECLRHWAKYARTEIKALIEHAFQTDKEGKLYASRILGLRQHNFDDPRWQKAMKAINDSIHTTSSSTYIRFYERDEKTGKYEHRSLDIAAL